jgi:hypothetical protein
MFTAKTVRPSGGPIATPAFHLLLARSGNLCIAPGSSRPVRPIHIARRGKLRRAMSDPARSPI